MKRYHEFKPTGFDAAGLNEDAIGADWLVFLNRNRDSDDLTESNFSIGLARLGGEGDDVRVHRFGHWACGWFEIIVVRPGTDAERAAVDMTASLEDYPILDEEDFTRREDAHAQTIWRDCYTSKDRAAYVREHPSQFDFRDWRDMAGCLRGRYFVGYASELVA